MSPEEKSVIAGIFDRLTQAENQPRDPDAERFIAERLRTQPYAPYVMAQAIYVQEQALANLSQQVEQLKAEVEDLSRRPQQSGGFLSGLFGGGAQPAPQPRSEYANAQAPGGQFGRGSVPQAGPQAAGPWGQQPQQPQQGGPMQSRFGGGGGSGFLGTAMTTALGVAGGMMIANAVSSAFSGGEASKLAGASEVGKDEAAKDTASQDTASQDTAATDDSWQSASYDDGGDDFGGGFDDEGFV